MILGELGENDEALAQQAQQGNREALMKLYDRYLPTVYRRVKSRVPAQQAEDVTQEIFIAVIRSLDRFEQRSRFSTWLYTIVNRQIAEFYRRHYHAHDHQSVSLDAIEGLRLAASPPAAVQSPSTTWRGVAGLPACSSASRQPARRWPDSHQAIGPVMMPIWL